MYYFFDYYYSRVKGNFDPTILGEEEGGGDVDVDVDVDDDDDDDVDDDFDEFDVFFIEYYSSFSPAAFPFSSSSSSEDI